MYFKYFYLSKDSSLLSRVLVGETWSLRSLNHPKSQLKQVTGPLQHLVLFRNS